MRVRERRLLANHPRARKQRIEVDAERAFALLVGHGHEIAGVGLGADVRLGELAEARQDHRFGNLPHRADHAVDQSPVLG